MGRCGTCGCAGEHESEYRWNLICMVIYLVVIYRTSTGEKTWGSIIYDFSFQFRYSSAPQSLTGVGYLLNAFLDLSSTSAYRRLSISNSIGNIPLSPSLPPRASHQSYTSRSFPPSTSRFEVPELRRESHRFHFLRVAHASQVSRL